MVVKNKQTKSLSKATSIRRYVFLFLSALILFLINVYIFYPGFMSPDSLSQLYQALGLEPISDWHPPLMAIIWSILIHITGAYGSFLIFQVALLWISLFLIATYLYEQSKSLVWPLLIIACGFLPFIVNISGVIWKDVVMAYLLLFAVSLILLMTTMKHKTKLVLFIVSFVSMLLAVQLRYNSFAAVLPLLMLAIFTLKLSKKIAAVCILAFILLSIAISFAVNYTYSVDKLHPEIYIAFDDVYHLSVRSDKLNEPTAVSILGAKATCSDSNPKLGTYLICLDANGQKKLRSNSSELITAWLEQVRSHPVDYIRYRLGTFFQIFIPDGSRPYYVWQEGISQPNEQQLKTASARPSAVLKNYINHFSTNFGFLFRPYFWFITAFIVMIFTKNRGSKQINKNVIYALCWSSILYTCTYIPLAAGSDYRYFYWSTISVLLAIILVAYWEINHRYSRP